MLQQTQVSVVIPYFEYWMRLFPTVFDLAKAPQEQVLKAWEGLGYYSRAKNLHVGAKRVVEEFNGVIPDDPEKLSSLKGLGPYTTAAILSFAYKQRRVTVDANVARVIARYSCIEKPLESSEVKKQIYQTIDQFLPSHEPWIVSEALIELGALHCTKNPECKSCPLKGGCQGLRLGKQKELPLKKAPPSTIYLFKHVAVISNRDRFLIQKGGEKGKVLHDLFEFPAFEGKDEPLSIEEAQSLFAQKTALSLKKGHMLPKQKQSYTRFQVSLYPYYFESREEENLEPSQWKTWEELQHLPFSSGHRRILRNIDKI